MSRAMTWLADRTQVAAGVAVTYTRAGAGVPVTAVAGDVADDVPGTTPPTRAEARHRDYLIRVADLAAAGVSGPPAVGDRITETLGGSAKTFEVVRRGDAPGWRYSDPERTTYRLHVKPARPPVFAAPQVLYRFEGNLDDASGHHKEMSGDALATAGFTTPSEIGAAWSQSLYTLTAVPEAEPPTPPLCTIRREGAWFWSLWVKNVPGAGSNTITLRDTNDLDLGLGFTRSGKTGFLLCSLDFGGGSGGQFATLANGTVAHLAVTKAAAANALKIYINGALLAGITLDPNSSGATYSTRFMAFVVEGLPINDFAIGDYDLSLDHILFLAQGNRFPV